MEGAGYDAFGALGLGARLGRINGAGPEDCGVSSSSLLRLVDRFGSLRNLRDPLKVPVSDDPPGSSTFLAPASVRLRTLVA